jgi:SAM-dependent methyltransferase
MNVTVRRRRTCRLCDDANPEPVLSLTPTPVANSYVDAAHRDEAQPSYPLDLFRCRRCGHVQLLDVVDPFSIFQRHRSAISAVAARVASTVDHANALLARYRPPPGSLIVGIGSNDGTMLRVVQDAGFVPFGIEPAVALAGMAIAHGVPTFPGFFTAAIADRVEEENGRAAMIVATSVLTHVDDLKDVVAGVRRLLAPGGIFAFDVGYLGDLVEKGLFDAVRHECLDYHAVGPLDRFLSAHGLELIAVERTDADGGRLRGVAQHAGGPHSADGSVAAFRALERRLCLDDAETVRALAAPIKAHTRALRDRLDAIRAAGGRIAAYGATTRATTLLHHLGVDAATLEFVVDDIDWKHGLFTPGLHLPVLAPEALERCRPDWLLVLAWDAADTIMRSCAAFRHAGGRFLLPLPDIRVV